MSPPLCSMSTRDCVWTARRGRTSTLRSAITAAHGSGNLVIETRPAASCIELVLRTVKRRPAAAADIGPRLAVKVITSRVGRFRTLLFDNPPLTGCQWFHLLRIYGSAERKAQQEPKPTIVSRNAPAYAFRTGRSGRPQTADRELSGIPSGERLPAALPAGTGARRIREKTKSHTRTRTKIMPRRRTPRRAGRRVR